MSIKSKYFYKFLFYKIIVDFWQYLNYNIFIVYADVAKWQTRKVQVLVRVNLMQVQVLSSAPKIYNAFSIGYFVDEKDLTE